MNAELDKGEQIDAFTADINATIEYYRTEFDLSVQAMIGVLEMEKAGLISIDVDFESDMDLSDD